MYILSFLLLACTDLLLPESAAEPAGEEAAVLPLARESVSPLSELAGQLSEGEVLVQVIDPGEEPRELLQFHPSPGDTHILHSVSEMDATIIIGGEVLPKIDSSPSIADTEVTVSAVDEDGTIHYSTELIRAAKGEEPDTPLEASESRQGSLVGLTRQVTVKSNGRLLNSDYQIPAGADEHMVAYIENTARIPDGMGPHLPDEPVGLGAKWEVISRVDINNIAVARRGLTELVARDGDRLSLDITISQEPLSWVVEMPSRPGVMMDINRFESGGTERVELDLGSLVPLRSSSHTEAEFQMTVRLDELEQIIEEYVTLDFDTERL